MTCQKVLQDETGAQDCPVLALNKTHCAAVSPGLTCCGQHGAGEEQGGHKVPVALGVVFQHGHSVVVGLQRAGQKLLQARVGHTGMVAQEVLPVRHELPPELLLVGQLDGGEDPGADYQVKDVTNDQQRKTQR